MQQKKQWTLILLVVFSLPPVELFFVKTELNCKWSIFSVYTCPHCLIRIYAEISHAENIQPMKLQGWPEHAKHANHWIIQYHNTWICSGMHMTSLKTFSQWYQMQNSTANQMNKHMRWGFIKNSPPSKAPIMSAQRNDQTVFRKIRLAAMFAVLMLIWISWLDCKVFTMAAKWRKLPTLQLMLQDITLLMEEHKLVINQ